MTGHTPLSGSAAVRGSLGPFLDAGAVATDTPAGVLTGAGPGWWSLEAHHRSRGRENAGYREPGGA